MRRQTLKKLTAGFGVPVLLMACNAGVGDSGQSSSALGRPKPIITMPTVGKKSAIKPFGGTANNVTYYGGPVIPNVSVTIVFWGSGATTYQSDLTGFFGAITNSAYLDNLAQYSAGGQTIGRGSLAGTYVDTSAPGGTTIDDSQIASELQNLISAGKVPANGPNNLYFFYFPPGVSITMQGGSSCSSFCGYHSTTTVGGSDAFYAVIPDLTPSSCGGCAISGQTQLQSTTEVSSHEMAEAITDPGIGLDLSDPSFPEAPVGWYNTSQGEVGDICAWQTGTLDGYTVQAEWSNAAGACTITPSGGADGGSSGSSEGGSSGGGSSGGGSGGSGSSGGGSSGGGSAGGSSGGGSTGGASEDAASGASEDATSGATEDSSSGASEDSSSGFSCGSSGASCGSSGFSCGSSGFSCGSSGSSGSCASCASCASCSSCGGCGSCGAAKPERRPHAAAAQGAPASAFDTSGIGAAITAALKR